MLRITGKKSQLTRGCHAASAELIWERQGAEARHRVLSPQSRSYWTFWPQIKNVFVLDCRSPKASSLGCLDAFLYFSKSWFASVASEPWVRVFPARCVLREYRVADSQSALSSSLRIRGTAFTLMGLRVLTWGPTLIEKILWKLNSELPHPHPACQTHTHTPNWPSSQVGAVCHKGIPPEINEK